MSPLEHSQRAPDMAPRFPDWSFGLPAWKWFEDLIRDPDGNQLIKVEEFTEDGSEVVRAELPGIDPERDVEISVEHGMLSIRAERTEKAEAESTTGRFFHRRELRYGSFARSIPLPEGVDETNVTATYNDGILEVKVPMPAAPAKEPAHRVEVSRS